MSGPQEHAKKYDKYSDLVTKKADADVERFLLEGHDFDRFAVVCAPVIAALFDPFILYRCIFQFCIVALNTKYLKQQACKIARFLFSGSRQVCKLD
jgi:hypothetical protein